VVFKFQVISLHKGGTVTLINDFARKYQQV